MANIVVFGKPRAFESYEYVFDGEHIPVENAHSEPILKPVQYQDPILHYYAREGYAGVEYYTRAKGFESERAGIVFGVSLKSSTDFNIFDTISKILQPFWVDFASALLSTNDQFIEDSITSRLKNTQWSNEEIESIQRTSLASPIPTPEQGVLLLVAENIEDIISVENLLKGYEDVYISGSPEVFKESCNDVVFKEAEKKIFKIEDGQIVPWPEEKVENPSEGDAKSVFSRIAQLPIWGGRQAKNQGTTGDNIDSSNDTTENHRKGWLAACASILAIGLIVGTVIHFWPDEKSSTDDPQNSSESTEKPDDLDGISVKMKKYDQPIKDRLDLNPQIIPETCTSYYPHDITFKVSDESLAIVKVDENRNMYILEVKKHLNVNKKITIQAFIREKLLGEQTYTIAKKDEQPIADPNKFVVPPYKGRQRTIKEYIGNLRNDVNNNPELKQRVIDECQKIINSSNYHENADAIALRDSLKRTASSSF